MKLRKFSFVWNFWPPFIGLGISIKHISKDYKKIIIELKKRPWNVNYFGAQYGGGIFAMTDGVHMLMLIRNLPKKYKIWDKSATIDYLRRGFTKLTAEFVITDKDVQFIEEEMTKQNKMDWSVDIDIKDEEGQVVAKVKRILSIKLKT